ncbi:MAG: endo-1,4-beta-xylanase [Bacteroidaceae bacterium]|nr:endo-1,4-beta-xylanase [Bacteroidaceae bacterium]
MKKRKIALSALLASMLFATNGHAQLSKNPDKFLGNITTRYQVDYNGFQYYKYWNQLTCENESKWGSVEGTNGKFNWPSNQINYAKQHNFPFKWHALIWGAQHPSWFNSSMSPEQRYEEIVQWMDAIKKQYPNLELIDVANECVAGHQADTYLFQEALGGSGVTGWDWLIKAFELAYERWPNAIPIYNDYNTIRWNQPQFIDLVKTLRDAGAPIDAYGNQAHDLNGCSLSELKSSLNTLNTSLKMPMYITEYDIGTTDDASQKKHYSEQIPAMWEADYCAGITLWGWHYGCTWTSDRDANGNEINNGHSGLIMQNKTERPALTWLKEYMQTEKALNAKSPFPGMVKEASVYVKPQALNIEKGVESIVTVRARMRTKTIEKIDLYEGTKLIATMTEPTRKGEYDFTYAPTALGTKELKAVVTCTDGFTWTRYSQITACNPRAPYKNKPATLPGKVEFENFDSGADGIAFHDMNSQRQDNTGSSYRTDTGIDIGKAGSNYEVGYTEAGEWMEYTVDVKEAGLYNYDIHYATPTTGVTYNIQLSTADGQVLLTDAAAPLARTSTSGSWTTYKDAHGRLLLPLQEGTNVLRFNLVGGDSQYLVNLDYINFTRVDVNEDIKLALSSDPAISAVSTKTTIAASMEAADNVKSVTFYLDGMKNKTVTEAPFEIAYTPTAKGYYLFTAVAVDNDGKESNIASLNLKVNPKRTAYKSVTVPGVVEAENFDKGEEGFTFHDSDAEYHDKPTKVYRSDNEGVDIVEGNNGYVIGWTAANEWLEYTINVANPGLYTCEMTASNGSSASGSVTFSLVGDDGKLTTLWTVSCANTGAWGTYKVRKSTVKKELQEGKQIIRVTFKNGNVNLDNFELKCVEDYTPVEDIVVDNTKTAPVGIFNLSGQKVNDTYRGIVIKSGKKILQK